MKKGVMLKTVEVVSCKWHGTIPISMCMSCPYFGGYKGFKVIECKRG